MLLCCTVQQGIEEAHVAAAVGVIGDVLDALDIHGVLVCATAAVLLLDHFLGHEPLLGHTAELHTHLIVLHRDVLLVQKQVRKDH